MDAEILDARFAPLVIGHAKLERLWTGGRWLEGPAWFPAGRYLVWSDIPNDRLLRWDETDGSVSVFRQPCNNENGHAVDRQGRLVSCEHRGRCVSRTEHDGTRRVIADRWRGRRLNSPNDVTVAPDGALWFTDPTYGIDSDYEGDAAPSEIGAAHVYRVHPDAGEVAAMVTDMLRPNGLCFSPDGRVLYVAETGRTHDPACPAEIRAYDLDGTRPGNGRHFAACDVGLFDGLRCDVLGHVWAAAGDGVRCHAPDGTLIGRIRVPEMAANLCFGGAKRNRLFITAHTSLYAIYVNIRGAG
jgi:gluconolactonase